MIPAVDTHVLACIFMRKLCISVPMLLKLGFRPSEKAL